MTDNNTKYYLLRKVIRAIKRKILGRTNVSVVNKLSVISVGKTDFENKVVKKQVYNAYQDIFGHKGENDWGEYVTCTNCNRVYSIEDVYGFVEYVHISDLPIDLPSSFCCSSPLKYFHDHEYLNKKFELLFLKDFSIVEILRDDSNNQIVGLIMGYVAKGKLAWEENIKDKLIVDDNFKHNFFHKDVIYIDEIGIIKPYRKGRIPLLMLLYKFLKNVKKCSRAKDIIFWTNIDSKLFNLIQQFPYKIILQDDHVPARVVIEVPFNKVYRKVMIANMLYN